MKISLNEVTSDIHQEIHQPSTHISSPRQPRRKQLFSGRVQFQKGFLPEDRAVDLQFLPPGGCETAIPAGADLTAPNPRRSVKELLRREHLVALLIVLYKKIEIYGKDEVLK